MALRLGKLRVAVILAVAALAVLVAAELWLNPDAAERTGLGIGGADKGGQDLNLAEHSCGKGYYYTIEFDCWQKKDHELCYGVRNNPSGYCLNSTYCVLSGCCPHSNDCMKGGKCYDSNMVLTGDDSGLICYEGKWGICLYEVDYCEMLAGYYCDGEFWVKEEPAICRDGVLVKPQEQVKDENAAEPSRKCPAGEFWRGEWDCLEQGDDEQCGSADAGHGCCASEGQCWFGGRCYAEGMPISESSEWLCTEGLWDKCGQGDKCEKQGAYLCNGRLWSATKPEGCGE